ncbi:hypothetical protein ROZALSC1DRAFT_27046 [Rozella allomycis CSF55]|uniref:Lanthionine synthetase C-like domain-containing protein n=1 Tax=Rozella allomycis (strain CSF55) TaxID=988480 RepID=A0A075AWN5_ROZAC|nr:Lanthionine synthetase C-like domain-containing protein [Rozella allomycis CSF55]RKP21560.1 hypothetical protein ROZALSC1DRAFT_27046 [Rozella allomycis CSF55]|eukprot:EPZ34647.1 Lanthionine synthetase C-like domain-containing protein [Rozella allomycis CSF55]
MSKRYLQNPFYKTSEELLLKYLDEEDGVCKIKQSSQKEILYSLNEALKEITSNVKPSLGADDYSVYSGLAGISYTFLKIFLNDRAFRFQNQSALTWALKYIEASTDMIKANGIKKNAGGFLGTQTGCLSLASVIYSYTLEHERAFEYVNLIFDSVNRGIVKPNITSEELLYGKAGIIYSLLFIYRNFFNISQHLKANIGFLTKNIAESIIKEGKKHSTTLPDSSFAPSLWFWHGKAYLGAAHGVAGILAVLLQIPKRYWPDNLSEFILESLNFLSSQIKGGKLKATTQSSNDDLVQFCHGPSGITHLLTLAASKSSNDRESIVEVAKTCVDTVWQKGILKKGVGLCHGISGNAYACLDLFKLTREKQYLVQTLYFSERCMSWKQETLNGKLRLPDAPYSLMEGLCGAVCLWNDLLWLEKRYHGFLFKDSSKAFSFDSSSRRYWLILNPDATESPVVEYTAVEYTGEEDEYGVDEYNEIILCREHTGVKVRSGTSVKTDSL